MRQNEWKQARGWAAAALELGSDESLRARYLLCDAHVKRIDGDAAIADRALREGLVPPPKPGRADDFKWPRS